MIGGVLVGMFLEGCEGVCSEFTRHVRQNMQKPVKRSYVFVAGQLSLSCRSLKSIFAAGCVPKNCGAHVLSYSLTFEYHLGDQDIACVVLTSFD